MEQANNGNRVDADLNVWTEVEQMLRERFGEDFLKSRAFLKDKLTYFDTMLGKYQHRFNEVERLTLSGVKFDRDKLEKSTYPNALVRLIRRIMEPSRQNKLAERQAYQVEANMHQIKARLVQLGFKNINQKLDEMMQQGREKFSLPYIVHKDAHHQMSYDIDFEIGKNGLYDLKGYMATLVTDGDKLKPRQHYFNNSASDSFTESQAFNLLSERYVLKQYSLDDQRVLTWKHLDLNDKDADGNYKMKDIPHNDFRINYDSVLNNAQFPGSNPNSQYVAFFSELTNGNRVAFTQRNHDGSFGEYFAEANPLFQSLKYFNKEGTRTDAPGQVKKTATSRRAKVSQGKKGSNRKTANKVR